MPDEFAPKADCPISGSLLRVGDRWTVLILRDCFYGASRFDQFQQSLGIAPSILTRRLNSLVRQGLLRRSQYQQRPPRFEYLLTEAGRDFRPVLLALGAWGRRHALPAAGDRAR